MAAHPFDTLTLPNGTTLIFTPCPGTKDSSVGDALQALREGGADAVATLLSDAELASLTVPTLGAEVSKQALAWFQLPIEDDAEPCEIFEKMWTDAKGDIFRLFNTGKTIAIHCKGGSGRTGLMAAILLLESGEKWSEVQSLIQSVRPKALTHAAHLHYLNKHYSI